MSLLLSIILKELETSPTSIIPILSSLHNNKAILQNISKQDRKHLVSRVVNLTRSPVAYNKWCGVNLLFILSDDFSVLAEDGAIIISQLIKIVEQQQLSTSLFSSAVDCLDKVCSQIRGKPTLTREILTPKLPQILSLYMEKLEINPLLIINSLTKFLKNHPTTFRPYGNKLKARLIEFITLRNFLNFPKELKSSIYVCLASLPIIEKVEPETKWHQEVTNLVLEIIQVALIYKEFMNFNDDEEMSQQIVKLTSMVQQQQTDNLVFSKPLDVDVNDLSLLFQISERLEILCGMLSTFLTTDTQFAVRVPIGLVLTMCDVICLINTRFISFRNDTYDPELKSIIKLTLTSNHHSITKLLADLPKKFNGNLLPHLSNIFALLEILIPFSNKRLDSTEILNNEEFMTDLLDCVNHWISLTASVNDANQVLRFIEVALTLVEPKHEENITKNNAKQQQQQKQNGHGKKNKKKSNNSSAPLSDLLSHQHLFTQSVTDSTVKSVRIFIDSILKRVNIPPTQYYKIMKYVFVEAARAKKYSYEKSIPIELRTLLIDAVLYPGNESVSLLPLVSNLLGDEPIMSVFDNPRFPPLAKYAIKTDADIEVEEEEEEEEEEEDLMKTEELNIKAKEIHDFEAEESSSKRQKIVETTVIEVAAVPEQVPEEMVFKASETKVVDTPTEPESEEAQETITSTTSTFNTFGTLGSAAAPQEDEDDNSDFEMPSIDVDDDDDDE